MTFKNIVNGYCIDNFTQNMTQYVVNYDIFFGSEYAKFFELEFLLYLRRRAISDNICGGSQNVWKCSTNQRACFR